MSSVAFLFALCGLALTPPYGSRDGVAPSLSSPPPCSAFSLRRQRTPTSLHLYRSLSTKLSSSRNVAWLENISMEIHFVEPLPQSEGVFYATNNPYQVSGPRGFTELKLMDETKQLFVRIDFPGVIKDTVKIQLEPSKKAVFVSGDAPKELPGYDASFREFGTVTGLVCDCCKISNVESYLGDGVIRLILSKKVINYRVGSSCSAGTRTSIGASSSLSHLIRGYDPEVAGGHPLAHLRGYGPQGGHRGTDPLDPAFTGRVTVPNPSVLKGSSSAYESKQLPDGGLFLRIDMPGVPNEEFAVTVEDGCVTVTGRAHAEMHDSSGREYRGNVAVVPRDYDCSRIEAFANEGVIRLIIHPM